MAWSSPTPSTHPFLAIYIPDGTTRILHRVIQQDLINWVTWRWSSTWFNLGDLKKFRFKKGVSAPRTLPSAIFAGHMIKAAEFVRMFWFLLWEVRRNKSNKKINFTGLYFLHIFEHYYDPNTFVNIIFGPYVLLLRDSRWKWRKIKTSTVGRRAR